MPMRQRRFLQVDVFSNRASKGNGLAVVVDADDLSTEQMQAFAAWTNLAETTFLLPPTDDRADYRVRIFSPAKEMAFAGHPTLGSCMAWLHCANAPKDPKTVRQECQIGLVDIDISKPDPAFIAPPTAMAPMPSSEQSRLIAAMGIDPSVVKTAIILDNGPNWNLFELHSAADVLAVDADKTRWPEHAGLALIGAHKGTSDIDFEVRNIAPSSGMSEDPITGSLNAALARWMLETGRLTADSVAAQGTCIGREGRVEYRLDPSRPNDVLIGGAVQIMIDGTLTL